MVLLTYSEEEKLIIIVFPKKVDAIVVNTLAIEIKTELFIIYTSCFSGKPEGIVHLTAGYLLEAKLTHRYVFDINDIYWCTADVEWITGHSYLVYGALANCSTIFMYEGTPNFPDPGRFWKMIEQHKITILYTAPTVIRSFMK